MVGSKKVARGSCHSPGPGPQSPKEECSGRGKHIPIRRSVVHATGIRRTYEECIEAMHAEEERLGCKMTDREREGFAWGFHAPGCRAELRRLAALGVEPLDEHDDRS